MKVFKVTFEIEFKCWITRHCTMAIYAKDLDNAIELFEKWKAQTVDNLTVVHSESFEHVKEEPGIILIETV